jgi:hypothetical protein
MDDIKDKIVYLYLDNKTMTGYVGETKELDVRDDVHKKYDIKYDVKYPGRSVLMNNTDPVPLTDLLTKKEAWFVEHSLYEKYKERGYDMLQKPPHPNLWKRNKDKINNCKICDELGCNFTKERLEYIMAVHRVSKLCDECNNPFYFDPMKHKLESIFNSRKYCSNKCVGKANIKGSIEDFKICEHCGKKFYFDRDKYQSFRHFNSRKFCSNDCSNKHAGKERAVDTKDVFKICPQCNKRFYYDGKKKHHSVKRFLEIRKYCSTECKADAERIGSEKDFKICLECNKPFYYDKKKYKSLKNFKERKFCSKSCSTSYTNKARTVDGKDIFKICPVCNKPFYYDRKKHGCLKKFNNNSKFCSRRCAGINSHK